MPEQGEGRSPWYSPSRQSLMLAAAFVLPAILPLQFGWITNFLAIPVCYLLRLDGAKSGIVIIRNAILVAGLVGLVVGLLQPQFLPALIFSATLAPLGYCFHRSGCKGEDAATTGGRGIIVLGLSWLLFWFVQGLSSNVNPYVELQNSLISWLDMLYEQSRPELAAHELLNLKLFIDKMKDLFPRVLPGILGSYIIMTVWINQVAVNSLLRRLQPQLALWPKYSTWRLPEKFIWTLIVAGIIFIVGQNRLEDMGLSLLIVCGVIYFFQGLAVFLHFSQQWRIPGLLAALLFVIIGVHSMGLILTILGLTDVWIDFRQLQHTDQKQKS